MDDYRTLLNRSLIAVAACVVAVVICFYLVDRPVALLVQNHGVNKIAVLKWLTYPPPWVQAWSPLALVLLAVRRSWGPWTPCELALFLGCVSLLVADQTRQSLGDVCGRYWPETWHDDNPSFIGTDTYGFHPFQWGDDTGSFPSGHAARIAGFLGVFWLLLPHGRWLYALLALPMLAALVAMDYHFVGDVVAGSVLGGIVAAWAVRFGTLGEGNLTG